MSAGESIIFSLLKIYSVKVDKAFIMPEVTGSDHCPIALLLKFP